MAPVPQPDENRERPKDDGDDQDVDTVELPDFAINAESSSDSEDEDEEEVGSSGGYVLLPQDPDGGTEEEGAGPDSLGDDSSITGENVSTDMPNGTSIHVDPNLIHQLRSEDFPAGNNIPSYLQVPDLPKPERRELLWNQPRTRSPLSMDPEHVTKIRSCMAGFQLPVSHTPDWARDMSEQSWKELLTSRLYGTVSGTKTLQEAPAENTDSVATVEEPVDTPDRHTQTSEKT